MKTIQVLGEPFKVTEDVADAIADAERDRDADMAMARMASMAEQLSNLNLNNERPIYMDSAGIDTAIALHRDGLMDIVDYGGSLYFVQPSVAVSMANEGLIVRTDAAKERTGKQCPGGYWIAKGRNCRSSGAAKAGARSLDQIASGGKSSKSREERQARIAQLKAKLEQKSQKKVSAAKAKETRAKNAGKNRLSQLRKNNPSAARSIAANLSGESSVGSIATAAAERSAYNEAFGRGKKTKRRPTQ